MEQGTVSGRVALLLRSAEVKPMSQRFVQQDVGPSLFFFPSEDFRAGLLTCHCLYVSNKLITSKLKLMMGNVEVDHLQVKFELMIYVFIFIMYNNAGLLPLQ